MKGGRHDPSKSLPARPSLDSLRKQAKKLARDVAAGDAERCRTRAAQLPALTAIDQRNAQLVIARENGYAGWQDLTAEVSKRLGNSLEWAAAQARRVIHDDDLERSSNCWLNIRRCSPGRAVTGRRPVGNCDQLVWRLLRPVQRTELHARGVRRAAHRRRGGRAAVGVRGPRRVTRQGPAASCFGEGTASAHAQVLCGAR